MTRRVLAWQRNLKFTAAAQVATAIVFYPVSTRKGGRLVVQAWLQGLAWAERTRNADLAARNARLAGLVKVAHTH
jgi:hypothetical protein